MTAPIAPAAQKPFWLSAVHAADEKKAQDAIDKYNKILEEGQKPALDAAIAASEHVMEVQRCSTEN